MKLQLVLLAGAWIAGSVPTFCGCMSENAATAPKACLPKCVCVCPDCHAMAMQHGKCACGKAVQEVTPKGLYTCACPGGKCCSMVSDKPGKCACGTDMKKVE